MPEVIPAGVPSQLLRRRLILMEVETGIMAQNAKVGAAIANRFPSISLTAFGGAASPFLTNLNGSAAAWNVGAGLVGPLFEWGRTSVK